MLNYFLDFLIKLFIFEERTHTGSIEMYIKSLPLLYYGKEVWGAIITLLRRGGGIAEGFTKQSGAAFG